MKLPLRQIAWRRLLPVLIVVGLAGLWSAGQPAAATDEPTDTITITAPNNVTIPESSDYATEILHNPGDMNDLDDLDDLDTPYHFSAVTLSDGAWQATTLANDSFVMLQHQSFTGSYSWVGQDNGINYPISTTTFTRLRMRLYVSQNIPNAIVSWFGPRSGVPLGNSRFIDLVAGAWHTYDIDLAAGGPGANGSWTAQPVAGLRLGFPRAGTRILVDWVRLTRAAGTNVQISWTYSGSGSSMVHLYLSTDPNANGADEQLLASVPASSNSYTWTGAGMAPGTYYIHAELNGARGASGPLVVAPRPIVRIDAPSTWSGEDYAAARLSALWNGANTTQFPVVENITGISYLGDYLQTSATSNDPTLWWLAYDQGRAIDTSRYRYMNIRLWLQAPSNSPESWLNAGPRMTWSVPTNLNWEQSENVVAYYNRWLPITYDMATVPKIGGGAGWSGQVTTLRFDPHEQDDANRSRLPDFLRIGGAHLTSQPLSNQATLIRWTPLQGSGVVDLYWDTDNQGYNGTLIANNLPLGAGSYGWNTAALPTGNYWIYLITRDGGTNTDWQYSLVPVAVNHGSPSTIFTDVPTNYFLVNQINDLATRGIISGYNQSDSTVLFRPGNSTTRGQLCKMIVLALGWPINTAGGPHFSDVGTGNPFYTFVETAYNRGVISGYSDGTFRPNANVTRGQTAKILVLAFGWPINTAGGPHFSDVGTGNPFYTFIETAFNRGIISGYSDGTFRPGNDVTRGQLAKMISQGLASP